MLLPRYLISLVAINTFILVTGVASGQDYPSKPIRIVTVEPGGSSDFVARLLAHGLSANLGQAVIVENRPNVVVPGEVVAKATPDGYTLLLGGQAHWLLPFLRDRLPWDPMKDFLPVSLTSSQPNILVVHPSLPVKSVKDVIDLAKSRPGQLNYATPGTGASGHIAGELFNAMAAVNIVNVRYKGNGPALNGLIGNEVQLSFPSAGAATPHIKSGRLRALAMTSVQPSALLPGLPSVSSTLPGYEAVSLQGMFVPAKTPTAIITRLNQEVVRVLNKTEVKERFLNAGIEPVGNSAAAFAEQLKSDMARLGKLIRDVGMKAE